MREAFCMVLSRWAMTSTVCFFITRSSASCNVFRQYSD